MEGKMDNAMDRVGLFYGVTLQKYLENEQEAVLEHAYELGRTAIAQELGVLDVARIHQEALGKMLGSPAGRGSDGRVLKSAESFFLQSLSAFEATNRGFREMNVKLQERNRELEGEIGERRRAESALQQSKKHYNRVLNEARGSKQTYRIM